MTGLFNLNELMNMGDNDIMDLSINEGIDDNIGVSVVESGIGRPNHPGKSVVGATITSDVYNNTMRQLQQSFKEGVELLDLLMNVEVVNESIDVLQERFTEDSVISAIIESYDNGPYFESSKNPDKEAIKKITKELRKELKQFFSEKEVEFKEERFIVKLSDVLKISAIGGAASIASFFIPVVGPTVGTMGVTTITIAMVAFITIIKHISWQLVGMIKCKKGDVNKIRKELNKTYKDTLGDFKIFVEPPIDDRLHEEANNNTVVPYVLIVGRELPEEYTTENFRKEVSRIEKELESKKNK